MQLVEAYVQTQQQQRGTVSTTAPSLEETIVYRLSDRLGGRSEVVSAPFVELLSYLITSIEEDKAKVEEKQVEYYLNFIAMLNSNPQNEKQAKETDKFMKSIKPKLNKNKSKDQIETSQKNYQWPERVRKKMEQKQREREQQQQQ